MHDKFVRGFIAGIFSGVIINALSFIAGAIGITNLRTADLIGVLIYAKAPPYATHEVILALIFI